MKSRLTLKMITVFTVCFLLCGAMGLQQPSKPAPGTATGEAIGTGLKAFMTSVFPAGATLLDLVQSWLSKKLDKNQQKQVQAGADTKKQADVDPKVTAAKQMIQNAADTMKLTSVVLYRTNKAAAELTAMLAILDTTPKTAGLPFSRLAQQWNDVKGELAGLKEDSTLQKARAAVTDTAVSNALQGLDDVTRGPVSTLNDNLKPQGGDRDIVRQELNKILSATVDFNNLGVVLLSSTGTEITRVISNLNMAAGGSELDQLTATTLSNAMAALPQPSSAPPR